MLFRFILLLLTLHTGLAHALSVNLLDTSPTSPAQLNQDQALYVRIHYNSDQPLRFQATGKQAGQNISDGIRMNPSQAYPAGEGEAIAWVAFNKPNSIDELIVTIYDANWRPLQSQSLSLSAQWQDGQSIIPEPDKSWVATLNQQQQASVGQQTAVESGILIQALVPLLFFAVPLYWILQIILLCKWSGIWRQRASLPLVISLPLLLYTLYALGAGSNLWPLMMIFITPIPLVILLILMWYKRYTS